MSAHVVCPANELQAPDLHACRCFSKQLHELCSQPGHNGHNIYLFCYAAVDKFMLVCKQCGAMFDGGALQRLKAPCANAWASPQNK